MAKRTTPEKPPQKSEATIASKGLRDPKSLTQKEIKTLSGRVLSEENKRKG